MGRGMVAVAAVALLTGAAVPSFPFQLPDGSVVEPPEVAELRAQLAEREAQLKDAQARLQDVRGRGALPGGACAWGWRRR